MEFEEIGYAPPLSPEPPRPVVPVAVASPMPAPAMGHLGAPRSLAPARVRAGFGLIAAAAGAGTGAVLGGAPGAVVGLASVGAVRNLYRIKGLGSADAEERSEGVRALAIFVVAAGLAGYVGYKAFFSKDYDE